MTMSYEEAIEHVNETVWGENSDDTKVLARMLIELTEQQRVSNLLKLLELGLVAGEELEALKASVKNAVGLPAQQPLA